MGPNHSIELRRITLEPEVSVKGLTQGRRLVFYRYDCIANCLKTEDLSWLPKDSRRVFFLTDENSALRSTVDVFSSAFPVLTGRRTSLVPGENDNRAIARLLVEPSPGTDLDGLADYLFNARAIARDLINS
jgi:hypothetical protein